MKYLAAALVIFFIATKSSNAAPEQGAKDLVVTTFDGANFDLKAKQGKIVIVNFWAYWCTICQKEMLILDQLQKKFKPSELEIIGISIDSKRERKRSSKIAQTVSYPNAMLIDAQENTFEEPEVIPTTYIINKTGRAALKLIPSKEMLSADDLEVLIKPLL